MFLIGRSVFPIGRSVFLIGRGVFLIGRGVFLIGNGVFPSFSSSQIILAVGDIFESLDTLVDISIPEVNEGGG